MIELTNHTLKLFTYPAGERGCVISPIPPMGKASFYHLTLTLSFQGSDDIIDMLNVVNAFRNMYGKDACLNLVARYLPFSRQDRVTECGGAFSLQMFAEVVKLCNFNKVYTSDAHSDVSAALFPAGMLDNRDMTDIWDETVMGQGFQETYDKVVLISPDAGALKKVYKLAQACGLRVAEARKVRDVETGAITHSEIDMAQLSGVTDAYIVDDICDGGRTFTELGKLIRDGGYKGSLTLCVTHGIFSKGLHKDFEVFTNILCKNVMRPELEEQLSNFEGKQY